MDKFCESVCAHGLISCVWNTDELDNNKAKIYRSKCLLRYQEGGSLTAQYDQLQSVTLK